MDPGAEEVLRDRDVDKLMEDTTRTEIFSACLSL